MNPDFPMRCPQCGCEDQIDILCEIFVRLTADGTDPDLAFDRSHSWENSSFARCNACDHGSNVGLFLAGPQRYVP